MGQDSRGLKTKACNSFVGARQAIQTTSLDLKEQWGPNMVGCVRHHLKDVKKGWFNIEEVRTLQQYATGILGFGCFCLYDVATHLGHGQALYHNIDKSLSNTIYPEMCSMV